MIFNAISNRQKLITFEEQKQNDGLLVVPYQYLLQQKHSRKNVFKKLKNTSC